MKRFAFFALTAIAIAEFAPAQAPAAMGRPSALGSQALAQAGWSSADGSGAFALEALGGTAGSLLGIGAMYQFIDCKDLGCEIQRAVAAGAVGVLGATLGTTLAARQTGSRRSAGGAAAGALVGTGVGVGVHVLLNRNSDRNIGSGSTFPIFGISQGVLAAMGSRLVGAAKGMR